MKLPVWNLLSPRQRKITAWILGLVAFYTITGFLILPPIVRSVAVRQLSAQLDREVSIQSVKINPFALSTTIRGLLIKDKDGEPFVAWDEVYVNFELVSLFSHAWTFKEISTSRPFVRAQMNKDGTFNFTDLITKFTTNAAPAEPKKESKPLVLHIGRLHIGGATAAVSDFTPREPFKRTLGPLDITLDDFRTDPDNKNPYAFTGTTDAGEKISWRGFFYLSPLRSEGELKLFNFTLNKYAPLYQDLVKFEIRAGMVALDVKYKFALDATNLTASVTDSAFGLRDFKLGAPGDSNNLAELPAFAVTGLSADLQAHTATINAVSGDGAKLFLSRNQNAAINVVELAKPSVPDAAAADGILLLLRSVTNAVAMLLNSTNQWSGAVNAVDFTNCAVHLEDRINSRPARLDLTNIAFSAKNISNLPGTNLTAELSLRWNTNGSIKTAVSASFLPPTAEVQIDLDRLDLGSLDPYLEPKVNLYILGSELGLHGAVHLRTPKDALPEVTFHGDLSLDGFHTVDGAFGEDLLKWDSLHVTGIDANLNPQSVVIREIFLNGAYARLVIETNKTINLLNALRLTNTNAPVTKVVTASNTNRWGEAPDEPGQKSKSAAIAAREDARPTSTTNAPLPQISIGTIVISNTTASFSDRSMQPNVNLTIQDVNGTIAGISTAQLQHADVNLGAKVDGVGPVSITGTINPFSGTQTNTIKIAVHDVDLTPTSPYAGKFAGYQIAEGKLNLNLNYQIIGKQLDAKNVITLDRFTFGNKVDSAEATHLPVRLAIAILKDREGKIILDVPVQGSLDDPKFRISKVVWGTLENILVKVATSPFSLLGAAFGGGGEELGQQDFGPGSAELTVTDKGRLDTLLKALDARPGLNLEIAGSVDAEGDREGLQRAALDGAIRTRLWQKFRKAEQATNSVDAIVLKPATRAKWVKRLYAEAVADGKITPQFIAANTNLAAYAAAGLPKKDVFEKGATKLMSAARAGQTKPVAAYPSKLVPLSDPTEAVLLATYPVSDGDLETLAANRAKAVQAYLLQSGKVTAARLFLKQGESRRDGSKVMLSFH
jgi:hypothetical protein